MTQNEEDDLEAVRRLLKEVQSDVSDFRGQTAQIGKRLAGMRGTFDSLGMK